MTAALEQPTRRRWIIAAILAFAAIAASASLLGDSATYDETAHLTSGYSYLRTGDFRLAPDHPPLAKMWAALPVLLMQPKWDAQPLESWRAGDSWSVGTHWLFELNDGQRLLVAARCMIVVLLLLTLLCIHALSARLFGPRAGLLSLLIAALCPTMLAHGRLVTTDMPATLTFLAALLAFARLLDCITIARVALAALALSAAALTKFSWPLVLPGLLVIGLAAALRRAPLQLAISMRSEKRPVDGRLARAGVLAGVGGICAVIAVLAIWLCFGLRYTPVRDGDEGAHMISTSGPQQRPATSMQEMWALVETDAAGAPLKGVTIAAVRWARDQHLLPEAYLYGLAYTAKTSSARASYLLGDFGVTGDPRYFPIAFAIKTPIPTMLLAVAGIAAIALRRAGPIRDAALALGLATFVITFATATIASGLNIGHRHILPLYPALFVLGGAAASWAATGVGRFLVAAAAICLAVVNLRAFPHYLSYFNETIGGPARGHLYLADSNIDWGQDLLRLRAFAAAHPDDPIKLWYFGSAEPNYYLPAVECLAGNFSASSLPHIETGIYVFSLTHFLGVYRIWARPEFWNDERNRVIYQKQHYVFGNLPPSAEMMKHPAARQFADLRAGKLAIHLRDRTPDFRIGWSLLGFRLTRQEVEEFTAP